MPSQTDHQKRWYESNKEHANQISKEWYAEHKDEQNARRREQYQKIKNDPILWAAYQEKERERSKRKRANWTDAQKKRAEERARSYRLNKPDANRRASRNCHNKARKECLEHYGGKCACCGESIPEFLAIDHIDGGGNTHRKTIGAKSLFFWLRANNYPGGFQILCHNCNHAKGSYGVCPHETSRLSSGHISPVV